MEKLFYDAKNGLFIREILDDAAPDRDLIFIIRLTMLETKCISFGTCVDSQVASSNQTLTYCWSNGISRPAHFAAAVLSKAVLASRTRVMQLGPNVYRDISNKRS